MRAHGWDVRASVTSPSGQDIGPVWETWYSGGDLFEKPSLPTSSSTQRGFERAH
jgi:hypothetical protein